MKKVLEYFLIIFALFLLIGGVNASEYTCKYNELKFTMPSPSDPDFGDFTKGTISSNRSITFKVTDGNVKWKNVSVENVEGGKEEIVNWKEEKGGFSAQNYILAEACPPYMFARLNGQQWRYYVFEKTETVVELTKESRKLYIFKLVEGPQPEYDFDKKFSIIFESNYPSELKLENEEKEQRVTYLDILKNVDINIKNDVFSAPEYVFNGWEIGRYRDDGTYVETVDTIKELTKTDQIFNTFAIDNIIVKAQWIHDKLGGCNDYNYKHTCENNGHYSCIWNGSISNGVCIDSEVEETGKDLGGCNSYNYRPSCIGNGYYSCMWNETKYGDYCNVDKLLYVKCGDAKDIPYQVPQVFSLVVNFLKILAPIILIFISIISLLKATSAANEDEIKKAQKGLVRKLIAAAMVFFVISIVQFVIMKVADSETKSDENGEVETENLSDCLNCFLNNECGESVYYKTYVGSEVIETFLDRNE